MELENPCLFWFYNDFAPTALLATASIPKRRRGLSAISKVDGVAWRAGEKQFLREFRGNRPAVLRPPAGWVTKLIILMCRKRRGARCVRLRFTSTRQVPSSGTGHDENEDVDDWDLEKANGRWLGRGPCPALQWIKAQPISRASLAPQ
jgi:hypothetical protein